MENIILIAVLLLIVGLAAWYVIRTKKSGRKCIGCPHGGSCPHAKNGQCTCGNKYE